MQVVLVMFRPDGERRSFSLARDKTVIGRREDCDLRIPVGDVSRKHCRFVKTDDQLTVEDLGSSNGTLVNGERVQSAPVSGGDLVTIGPVQFVVQIDGYPADEDIVPAAAGSDAEETAAGFVADPQPVGEDEPEPEEIGEPEPITSGTAGSASDGELSFSEDSGDLDLNGTEGADTPATAGSPADSSAPVADDRELDEVSLEDVTNDELEAEGIADAAAPSGAPSTSASSPAAEASQEDFNFVFEETDTAADNDAAIDLGDTPAAGHQ